MDIIKTVTLPLMKRFVVDDEGLDLKVNLTLGYKIHMQCTPDAFGPFDSNSPNYMYKSGEIV